MFVGSLDNSLYENIMKLKFKSSPLSHQQRIKNLSSPIDDDSDSLYCGTSEELIHKKNYLFKNLKNKIDSIPQIADIDQRGNVFQEIKDMFHKMNKFESYNCHITSEEFFYIFRLRAYPELEEGVYVFLNGVIHNNPLIANIFIESSMANIQEFVNMYRSPFFGWQCEMIKNLLNSGQIICDRLITFGLFDNLQSGFLASLSLGPNENTIDYWINLFILFELMIRHCSYNEILFQNIIDLCKNVINPGFLVDKLIGVISKSLDCLTCILHKCPSLKSEISPVLPLFEEAHQNGAPLFYDDRLLQSFLRIIEIFTKPPEPYDFTQTNLLSILFQKTFESKVFSEANAYRNRSLFLNIISYSLQSYPNTLDFILNNNILIISFILLEKGDLSCKESSGVLFSRLCDPSIWEQISDFFANNNVIIELANQLLLNISKEYSLTILLGFKSIVFQLAKNDFLENNPIFEQFYNDVFESIFNTIGDFEDEEVEESFRELVQMIRNNDPNYLAN